MLKNKVVKFMADSNVIEKDECEIYLFGCQLIEELVISFAVFTVISLLFHQFTETLIFVVAFSLIRRYAGGYHADNFITCLVISCAIIVLFNVCMTIAIDSVFAFRYGIMLISASVIVFISPVDNPNKKLSQDERKVYRKYTISFLFFEAIIVLVLECFSLYKYEICIMYSWFVLFISLIFGIVKNTNRTIKNKLI